jgi:hypothetical protein
MSYMSTQSADRKPTAEHSGTSIYYTRCLEDTNLSLRLRPLAHVIALLTVVQTSGLQTSLSYKPTSLP